MIRKMKTNYLLTNPSEFGKRCGLCHKNKESHQYYKPINGKWLKICQECWDKLERRRQNDHR